MSLASKPVDWQPPRKRPVRAYDGIVVGNCVMVAERYEARTPHDIRGEVLAVVGITDDLVTVEYAGCRYGIERRFLVVAG